jgi:hypothetical protein
LVDSARDTNDIVGNRKFADGTSVGDAAGAGGGNQAKGKYNRNTSHSTFTYPVTMNGYSYTEASWRNEDPSVPAGKTLDAPTGHDVPQNIQFATSKANIPLLHIGTFKAPVGYNREDSQAIRETYMLAAQNKSYLGTTGTMIGNIVGDTAINNYAAVCDSMDTAKLTSTQWFNRFQGHLYGFAFLPDAVLTDEQVRKVQANAHKLFG